MAGDPLKKVQSGQRMKISAAAYNEFVDAARANRARQYHQGQSGRGEQLPRDVVLVKNTAEADLEQFAVLAVSTPIILPADSQQGFLGQVAFAGTVPGAYGSWGFVVLLEPIKAGSIGRACITGVTPAKIKYQESEYSQPFAVPSPGETDALANSNSQQCGAQVLWSARTGTDSGTFWGLVKLGVPALFRRFNKYLLWITPGTDTWTIPQSVTDIRVTVVGGGGGGGGSAADYSDTVTLTDSNGDTVGIPLIVGTGGGGGGSSGMLVRRTIQVRPGDEWTITVGDGGTGGTAGVNGGDGEDSQFWIGGSQNRYIHGLGGKGGSRADARSYAGYGGVTVPGSAWFDSYHENGALLAVEDQLILCTPGENGGPGRTTIAGTAEDVWPPGLGGKGGKNHLLPFKHESDYYPDRGWGGNGAIGGAGIGEAGQPGYVLIEY